MLRVVSGLMRLLTGRLYPGLGVNVNYSHKYLIKFSREEEGAESYTKKFNVFTTKRFLYSDISAPPRIHRHIHTPCHLWFCLSL